MRQRLALCVASGLALAACSAAPRGGLPSGAVSPPASSPLSSPASSSPSSSPASGRTTAAASTSAPAHSHSVPPASSASPASPASSAAAARSGSAAQAQAPAARQGGAVIVLNPGHNGGNAADPAAINQLVPAGFGQYKACDTTGTETNSGGYPEHAFNWDVALRVRSILQAHGVRVIMTRSSDSGVGPCVDERARIGNQAGVSAVISIHADGAPVDGHGFHVCEDSRPPAGGAVAALSHRLTVAEHDALLQGSGMTTSTYLGSDGYYPRDDLAGLNLATVPATFLEIGNMRNPGDATIQLSAAGRQRIAAAVATGILDWLAGG
jgi:N-acetylmuramoyl-L-alanine amidase